MRHRTNPGKWKITASTDFTTGKPSWTTTPPRWVYRPHAEGKRSHDTYDQALAYVRQSSERRPLVFESKTNPGQWFWQHPGGTYGWEATYKQAQLQATGGTLEVA